MTMSKRLRKQKAEKIRKEKDQKYLDSLNLNQLYHWRDYVAGRAKSGISHFKEELIRLENEITKRKRK